MDGLATYIDIVFYCISHKETFTNILLYSTRSDFGNLDILKTVVDVTYLCYLSICFPLLHN